jgi:lysophospholipase L1-like esterase
MRTIGKRQLAAGLAAALGLAMGACLFAQDKSPDTIRPAPRDGHWMELHKRYVNRARQGNAPLVFLGDSITQGWNDNDVWKRFYAPRGAVNFGIGGDRTQHVLWRIENGEFDGIDPKLVVLMIGTNNLHDNSNEDIVLGVSQIVRKLTTLHPNTKILLLGIFPRGEKPGPIRERIKAINQKLAQLDDGSKVHYLDIGQTFLEPDGSISRDVMYDFLHLTPKGYRRWAEAIEPTVWSMLDEPR